MHAFKETRYRFAVNGPGQEALRDACKLQIRYLELFNRMMEHRNGETAKGRNIPKRRMSS